METQDKLAGEEWWRQRRVGALLFVLQLFLSASLVLTASFTSTCVACWLTAGFGAAVAIWSWFVVGLRRLSVLPEVRSDAVLVTAPPYRWIRHPMYAGLLLFCAGLVPTSYAHWKALVWGLLLITLDAKARVEERLLVAEFPDYEDYRLRSRRFVPFLY